MIEFSQLTLIYPNGTKALSEISLRIKEGEFVVLCGPTGCGKTSLLMTVNGLIPHTIKGELKGKVTVAGRDTRKCSVAELATLVGTVFQNPEAQIFNLTCEDELVFGVENLGLSREKITERLEYALKVVSLNGLRDRNTSQLSGGEKQRLVIGATLAMGSRILVLDEPLSDLDPRGKEEVLRALAELNQRWGITVVVAEHNLDKVLEFANRMLVMEEGRVVLDGEPRSILSEHHSFLTRLGIRLPQVVEASLMLSPGNICFSPEELSFVLKSRMIGAYSNTPVQAGINFGDSSNKGVPIVQTERLRYCYPNKRVALKDVSLSIDNGGVVAVVGNNGAGKSTLAKILIGLLKPTSGDVVLFGESMKKQKLKTLSSKVGFLFQNPDNQLFCDTVEEEVATGLPPLPTSEKLQKVSELLKKMGLEQYRNRHPHALSRGERQRVAVATALAKKPKVLVLDEPTTGQDWKHICALMEMMEEEMEAGITVIMITHDMRLVAEYADDVIVLSNGELKAKGHPRSIFSQPQLLKEAGLDVPPLAEASLLAGLSEPILSPGEIRKV